MIQSILCVKLSIHQGSEPCTVNIYGTNFAVDRAAWVIHEIVGGSNPIDVLTTFFGASSYSDRSLHPFQQPRMSAAVTK